MVDLDLQYLALGISMTTDENSLYTEGLGALK